MMDLEPLQLGVVGCVLLIVLCVLGVRIAFAAAIVGTMGLVSMPTPPRMTRRGQE